MTDAHTRSLSMAALLNLVAAIAATITTFTAAGREATGASVAGNSPRHPADATSPKSGVELKLHVPSPDWRDQIIYFLMTDRFFDMQSVNNNLGAGEFGPGDNAKYNGGDLRGVEEKLDYIRGLGATAVWITPPVANQWWDPQHQYSGYHGYWAENFTAVDRHLGDIDDYKRLSHRLHSMNMYLVQDIVLNHTGNFFSYGSRWSAKDPARDFQTNAGSRPVQRPSQFPFSMNDPRDPVQRRAGIYHWTPPIADYTNTLQEHNFQMAGLDDLNTENRLVRTALRDSYGYWIREVGVDAFRVDTAFYVPPGYFRDFLYSREPEAPGMNEVARRTGRDDFLVFGEGFGIDRGGEDKFARKIERYMTGPDGRPNLPAMLNFPLYGTAVDVFSRGRPTAELGWRINNMMKLHKRPHLMPTFVDNHDVDRFLSGGSVAALKQNLLLIMTLPGIPTIYYGTEQGFTVQRAAMFKEGYQSGGRDRFDVDAPLYQFIRTVISLRKENKVLSRGIPAILRQSAAGPGALAYRMTLDGEHLFVAFNTADSETLLDNVATPFPPGTVLAALYAIEGVAPAVRVGSDGKFSVRLPPRAGYVWRAAAAVAPDPVATPVIRLDRFARQMQTGDFQVSGSARPGDRVKVVVDGALSNRLNTIADAAGRWQARIDTGGMFDPGVVHTVAASVDAPDGSLAAVSDSREFRVSKKWRPLVNIKDAPGDDHGPTGKYSYPNDDGWLKNRQMDLRGIRVSDTSGALRIDLTMNKVTALWNPQNGFDHVALTIYLHIPGNAPFQTVMPMQNASLPGGMGWNYRLRAHGWSNTLFSATGASATSEGAPVTPGAEIRVDRASNTISFLIPASSLGSPTTFSGAKLYVTTWDYDGGYRALEARATGHTMGGGDGAREPLIMDDSAVIVLP